MIREMKILTNESIQLIDPETDLMALEKGRSDLVKIKPLSDSLKTTLKHGCQRKPKNALIIGATGFLGTHFIQKLNDCLEYESIYCFVRKKKTSRGIDRIKKNLESYYCYTSSSLTKIKCIESNYTDDFFGLTENEYYQLADKIDIVFHFASNTDYRATYNDFRKSFILKNIDILNFCITGKPKHIHYVGSSIAYIYQNLEDFARPNTWWFSGYSKMKWVNVNLFRSAFENDIQGAVYLPPYILGSTGTGVDPGYVYSFWRIVVWLMELKKIWDGEFFQVIPVDILCDIILHNSLKNEPCKEIIPTLPTIQTSKIANILNCEVVSWEECFQEALNDVQSSEKILIEEIDKHGLSLIERTNLEPKGMDVEFMSQLPSYADVLKNGLAQEKLRFLCRTRGVVPQL